MEVVTDAGERLGILTDVIQTGANDVYEVERKDGKPLLLPVIPECVLSVDVQAGVMRVHVLDGLL